MWIYVPCTRIKIMVTHYFVHHVHVLHSVPNFFMGAGRKKILFRNTFYSTTPPSPTNFFTSSCRQTLRARITYIIIYLRDDMGGKWVSVLLATRSRLLNDEIFRRGTMQIKLYHFHSMVRLKQAEKNCVSPSRMWNDAITLNF